MRLLPWVLLGLALGAALDWAWRRATRPLPKLEDHR
jgi:HAMP domain-containing protein